MGEVCGWCGRTLLNPSLLAFILDELLKLALLAVGHAADVKFFAAAEAAE